MVLSASDPEWKPSSVPSGWLWVSGDELMSCRMFQQENHPLTVRTEDRPVPRRSVNSTQTARSVKHPGDSETWTVFETSSRPTGWHSAALTFNNGEEKKQGCQQIASIPPLEPSTVSRATADWFASTETESWRSVRPLIQPAKHHLHSSELILLRLSGLVFSSLLPDPETCTRAQTGRHG